MGLGTRILHYYVFHGIFLLNSLLNSKKILMCYFSLISKFRTAVYLRTGICTLLKYFCPVFEVPTLPKPQNFLPRSKMWKERLGFVPSWVLKIQAFMPADCLAKHSDLKRMFKLEIVRNCLSEFFQPSILFFYAVGH